MKKINTGIVGSAGYTGGELIRLLIHHPAVNIVFAHSQSQAEKPVYQVHNDLLGDTDLKFAAETSDDIDILFLCVGHGNAQKDLEANPVANHVRIIDLSQVFRNNPDFRPVAEGQGDHKQSGPGQMAPGTQKQHGRHFIYGIPELNRDAIRKAANIANPGCFANGIQLALLPLASAGLLDKEVNLTAVKIGEDHVRNQVTKAQL